MTEVVEVLRYNVIKQAAKAIVITSLYRAVWVYLASVDLLETWAHREKLEIEYV